MHFTGRYHGGHAAVHGGIDPANLVLPGRPVAKYGVNVAVDQAGGNAGLVHVDGGFCAFEVTVVFKPHGDDQAVMDNDGVGVQNGPVNVSREQQADVFDDDFA